MCEHSNILKLAVSVKKTLYQQLQLKIDLELRKLSENKWCGVEIKKTVRKQVTRGHNIVADGWAGASNPIHTQTFLWKWSLQKAFECTEYSKFPLFSRTQTGMGLDTTWRCRCRRRMPNSSSQWPSNTWRLQLSLSSDSELSPPPSCPLLIHPSLAHLPCSCETSTKSFSDQT